MSPAASASPPVGSGGLLLGLVPTPAIVVLVYFGVAMWTAIPFLLFLAVARGIAADPSVPDDVWFVGGPGALALNLALALVIGGMLWVARLRGPLEAVTSEVASWAARVGGRLPA